MLIRGYCQTGRLSITLVPGLQNALWSMVELIIIKLIIKQTDARLLAKNSQHCWILHVASVCTPCCMLLRVVGSCCAKFETSQTFQPTTPNISFVPWSPKRSATMLDPFAQLFQTCWGHARLSHMVSTVLWVVSFPWCTAGLNIVGPTMWGVGASVCK